MFRWWQELGGPGLVTALGLLLLVSPGWSWPDALIANVASLFQEAGTAGGSRRVEEGKGAPYALPARENMTVEGLALADMMNQSGDLTLLWCGLELTLVAVMFAVMVPPASRRRRWLFHRPSVVWRLLHCDLPRSMVTGVAGLCLAPGLVISEWLRVASPSWPGTVLQAGVLVCGTALLVCVVRRSEARWGCRAVMVVPASLMVFRLIWILT